MQKGKLVHSVIEKTPAAFSRLQSGDEVIGFGFVDHKKNLVAKKGAPNNVDIETGAFHGKTLILALIRKS